MKILYLIVAVSIVIVYSGCYRRPEVLSDTELIDVYTANRDEFYQFSNAIQQEPYGTVVRQGDRISSTPSIPADRLKKFMNDNDIASISRNALFHGASRDAVFFRIQAWGNPSGGFTKGLMHGVIDVEPFDSLEEIEKSERKGLFFRKIEDGWYLFYERS